MGDDQEKSGCSSSKSGRPGLELHDFLTPQQKLTACRDELTSANVELQIGNSRKRGRNNDEVEDGADPNAANNKRPKVNNKIK